MAMPRVLCACAEERAKLAGKIAGSRTMKLTTPQIVWHSKEPVFSADFHHSGELWRLATAGADKDVKVDLETRRGR